MAAPESLAQRQWKAGWDQSCLQWEGGIFRAFGWMRFGPMVGEVGKEKDESSASFSLVAVFSRMWSSLGTDTRTIYHRICRFVPLFVSRSSLPIEHIYKNLEGSINGTYIHAL
jgi:hypothetical protein